MAATAPTAAVSSVRTPSTTLRMAHCTLGAASAIRLTTHYKHLCGDAMPAGSSLPKTGTYKHGDGTVNVFKDGTAAVSDFRIPYPGESGVRNNFRGDGIFNIDMGLDKRWIMPYNEHHSLQFRWEVFNVTNSVRFDAQSIAPEIDISTTFA